MTPSAICCFRRVVGRPLAIAQRLSAYGGPNSLRIAAGTWSLLTAAAAGASVKASCWRPTGRLLMGGCSVVDYFAYEPVRSSSWLRSYLLWVFLLLPHDSMTLPDLINMLI